MCSKYECASSYFGCCIHISKEMHLSRESFSLTIIDIWHWMAQSLFRLDLNSSCIIFNVSRRQTFLWPSISFSLVSVLSLSLSLSVCLSLCLSRALSLVRVRGVNIPGEQRALSLGGGLNHCSEGPMILPVPWDTHCIPTPSYSITHTYAYSNIFSSFLKTNTSTQSLDAYTFMPVKKWQKASSIRPHVTVI